MRTLQASVSRSTGDENYTLSLWTRKSVAQDRGAKVFAPATYRGGPRDSQTNGIRPSDHTLPSGPASAQIKNGRCVVAVAVDTGHAPFDGGKARRH